MTTLAQVGQAATEVVRAGAPLAQVGQGVIEAVVAPTPLARVGQAVVEAVISGYEPAYFGGTLLWIDIENSAGTKYGDGPIDTATGWSWTRRLDKAGAFSFQMPAGDPRAALVVAKRVAQAWTWNPVQQRWNDAGAGVIDKIRLSVTQPGMLEVSGDDLLRELTYRSVGDLACMVDATYTAVKVHHIYNGGADDDDMPESYDGNPATSDDATISGAGTGGPTDWLYVEYSKTFDRVVFTLGASVNNNLATLKGQYWNEESNDWEHIAISSDGTDVSGAPWGQSGTITFDMPKSWKLDGGTYQIRFFSDNALDSVSFAEVGMIVVEPSATALADIMALAPAGWTIDPAGAQATTDPLYLQFAGESVLAALVRLQEQSGEHFRKGPGRTVTWLNSVVEDSGVRAIAGGDPVDLEAQQTLALITALSEQQDAANLVSRVIPRGGGTGAARPDLALTTRAAPAGYTLDTVNNYLKVDAAETAYGRIEAALAWADIVAAGVDHTQKANAANALFDRCYEYLLRHSTVEHFYDLEVAKLHRAVLPGQTLRVDYDAWVDGYHAVDIHRTLIALESVFRIGGGTYGLVGLSVATIDRYPSSDAGTVAGAIVQGQVGRAQATPGGGRNSSAMGIPVFIAVEDGRVTAIDRVMPIGDGRYVTGVNGVAAEYAITIRRGVIVSHEEP